MANTDNGNVYYSEIAVGIDLLWNNKLDKAEEYFGKLKDSNPRYALHYAEVLVFRSIITEVAADREAAIQRMLTAIKLAEDQLKDLEKGNVPKNRTDITKENLHNYLLDTTVVLADAHTILAALQVVEEQRVKGMLNLRKGWKIYKNTLDSLKVESKHDDTIVSSLKFGAGLFYFIISLVPPGLPQKVASLAGFSGGDKDLGLKYLRECFASGSIRSYLAGIVLSINNLFLTADLDPSQSNDLIDEAEKIIGTGLAKYPEGSFFQSVASLAALERNNVDVAMNHSEVAIKNSEHVTTYPALFLRLLSNCHTMKFDWKTTCDVLEKLHQRGIELEKKQKSRNPWAFTWNAIRLGACHVMLGNHDKAKKLFTDCANSKTKDRWTQTFLIQAKKFLHTGGWFAMLELMLLTGHYEKIVHNCPLSKKEEILGVLDGIAKNAPGALTKPNTKEEKGIKGWFSKLGKDNTNDPKIDNRIAYLVLQAIVYRSMDRKEEAIANLQEVISLDGQLQDKMYYALALLEYGRIVAKDDPKLALKQFETGIKLNDFIWDSSVRTRIRTCMRQLGSDEPVLVETNKDVSEKDLDEDLEALMKAEENEVEK